MGNILDINKFLILNPKNIFSFGEIFYIKILLRYQYLYSKFLRNVGKHSTSLIFRISTSQGLCDEPLTELVMEAVNASQALLLSKGDVAPRVVGLHLPGTGPAPSLAMVPDPKKTSV